MNIDEARGGPFKQTKTSKQHNQLQDNATYFLGGCLIFCEHLSSKCSTNMSAAPSLILFKKAKKRLCPVGPFARWVVGPLARWPVWPVWLKGRDLNVL